jgi:hypothetical protein
VDILGDVLQTTALNWLRSNGCPNEVIEAIENSFTLQRFVQEIKQGSLADIDARELSLLVPSITETIMRLGGRFRGPDGACNPREDILEWPGQARVKSCQE